MPTTMAPAPLSSPRVKPTLETIIPEIRLKIYESLPAEPLALRPPPGTSEPHPRKFQSVSDIGILLASPQIRDEAISVLYRCVFLGPVSDLHLSYLPRMSSLCKASVKEALFDVTQEGYRFLPWLQTANPFPNLNRCKLYLESRLLLPHPTSEDKIEGLRSAIVRCGDWFPSHKPVPSVEIDLVVYLTWITVQPKEELPADTDMPVMCRMVRLHELYEFDVIRQIKGKEREDFAVLAKEAVEEHELNQLGQGLIELDMGTSS